VLCALLGVTAPAAPLATVTETAAAGAAVVGAASSVDGLESDLDMEEEERPEVAVYGPDYLSGVFLCSFPSHSLRQ
jgi:hypothetical protein